MISQWSTFDNTFHDYCKDFWFPIFSCPSSPPPLLPSPPPFKPVSIWDYCVCREVTPLPFWTVPRLNAHSRKKKKLHINMVVKNVYCWFCASLLFGRRTELLHIWKVASSWPADSFLICFFPCTAGRTQLINFFSKKKVNVIAGTWGSLSLSQLRNCRCMQGQHEGIMYEFYYSTNWLGVGWSRAQTGI